MESQPRRGAERLIVNCSFGLFCEVNKAAVLAGLIFRPRVLHLAVMRSKACAFIRCEGAVATS